MADRSNRIADVRKSRRLTQQALADRLGVHWVTISRLERGKIQLTGGWLTDLAKALSVEPVDLLPKRRSNRDVEAFGGIEDNGTVSEYPDGQTETLIVPSESADDYHAYWLVIKGSAFYPFADEHDLFRFRLLRAEEYDYAIGRICHFKAKDGRSLVGILDTSNDGSYEIELPGSKPLKGLQPENISVLIQVLYAVPLVMASTYGEEA